MTNRTLKNALLYSNNSNTSKLLKVIDYSIHSFCDSLGLNKSHFNKYLPYSDSQIPKYLNPNDETKNLKIIDLPLILNNLDNQHKKLILDSICQSHGFVCTVEASKENNDKSLENILLRITATNGNLSSEFIEALEDGKISDIENEKLNQIAYQLRSLIRTFEARINK